MVEGNEMDVIRLKDSIEYLGNELLKKKNCLSHAEKELKSLKEFIKYYKAFKRKGNYEVSYK